MGKAIRTWLLFQLMLLLPLGAQSGIEKLFPPAPSGFLNDIAGLVSEPLRSRIETRLQRLKDSTGAEVAVVTLPGIGDYAPGDVAMTIGRTWKVGADAPLGDRRRNAAAVLLVVPRTAEHRGEVWVSTGTGAEGFLPDSKAGRISDAMLAELRQGQYGEAIDRGTILIADLMARELGSQDSLLVLTRPRSEGRGGLVVMLIIVILVIIVLSKRGSGGGGRRLGPPPIIFTGGGFGGGFGGGGFGGGGFGGGGFGGFGGGGGFSGGGAGRGF